MASWLTSAIQTVRDKSIDAIDFVRRDLTEFTTTVKTDTETYLNKIKSQEVGDLGINRFVSRLSDSSKTDNNDEKHFQASASFDRVHNELTRLQNDESTYLHDPTPQEAYDQWRETTNFNIDARKGEIAQLLIDAPHVRSFYAHLVPAQTTHSDFWLRYYFRVHQIEEEEARRTQLLRRAHAICSENSETTDKNNENDWDELDEDGGAEPPPPTTEKFTPEIVSVEQQDNEEQQQQLVVPETIVEQSNSEQSESDTGEKAQSERLESDTGEKAQSEGLESDTGEKSHSEPLESDAGEKSHSERSESDTVSGDSWEREFDETDVLASKSPVDPLTISEQTVTFESLTSSTATAAPAAAAAPSTSSSEKKPENEFDDEWEAWA